MPYRRTKTHYQILGVDPDVASGEIKRAYRQLVKSHHPDLEHHKRSEAEKEKATEHMRALNDAYETLMDKARRAYYDRSIGIIKRGKFAFDSSAISEDQARELYLGKVFHPDRRDIGRVLSAYKKQLRELSLDIYDDELLDNFAEYVDHFEEILHKASNSMSCEPCPRSLDAAVRMMRYSIAQAADALEEMHFFCKNFDYSHLSMAESLVRISQDLSRQSLRLTRT